MALIFVLSGTMGVGTTRGDDTVSSDASVQEQENRSEEIQKALELAENPEKQKDTKSVPGVTSSDASRVKKNAEDTVEEVEQPKKGGVAGEKETSGPAQGPKGEETRSPGEKVPEASPEESLSEYAVLENVTWETSEKKVTLRLWISGQATPAVTMIRDQHGMKMRLRPQGLATRMRRTLSSVPPGVQSFSIREEPKLAKTWGLEAPYYAVEEIQTSFIFPVQYSLAQEPGLLKVTFLFPKKFAPEKIEPTPASAETIETIQREALESPETTLGSSYQSQSQFQDRILYGAQKPPSITDLYKRERENIEFKATSGLPDNVGPVLESRHPRFGSAEYFKKYVHGNIRQTFDYTTDYNDGTTSAFQETSGERGEPGSGGGSSGKDIGTILWTPAVALLFYRPGTFDISTGYSAHRDFPTTRNNFLYGLDTQNINLGIGHYPRKRYALAMQNNLAINGGVTRQKVNGRWVKSSTTQQSYTLNNNCGLNYRLNKRLIWGVGAGMSPQWTETKTTGVRNQNLIGGLNSYFAYRVNPRLGLLLGTDFTHVYKDTGNYQELTGPLNSIFTKGNNLQSVFLNANYRYSEKLTLTGGIQGTLIDWDIGKLGGSAGITYQRTPFESLSFKYASSVVQDNTAMILARSVNTNSGLGISLQRVVTMGLTYNRKFDRGKTMGSLAVQYMKSSPLTGVFYGGAGGSSTINYDILFKASVRRAILKNRASLGLLYSFDFAPNRMRNDVTGEQDFTTNTSQNITATMDYNF